MRCQTFTYLKKGLSNSKSRNNKKISQSEMLELAATLQLLLVDKDGQSTTECTKCCEPSLDGKASSVPFH